MVLCREGPGCTGRSRIEWYRSEDRAKDYQPVKVVDLDTIRSINPVERKKGFMVDLLEESMLFQCTSKADMEDWVRDINRFRQGVDLASGQNLMEMPQGHDVYEGMCCVFAQCVCLWGERTESCVFKALRAFA